MKLAPLRLGKLQISQPVILAPMAGITNLPFRMLCRELENAAVGSTSGLYICEMITARALVEKNPHTMHLMTFAAREYPRSMQLYTVDPATTYQAVKMIVEENLADHIDMNFGCPVPKVTRKGGGAALPYKQTLFRKIVEAAVKATGETGIPVTVKYRMGIDDEHETYLTAGKIAAEAGAAAITLHARTAAQRYSGHANWVAIKKLKETLPYLPIFGNGDIFSAKDMQEMLHQTQCDGVVIGRGCLGRPWLFAEIAAYLHDKAYKLPNLGEVIEIMLRHAELLMDFTDNRHGIIDFRKHASWYLKGFPVGSIIRRKLAVVESFTELQEITADLPKDLELPPSINEPRGRKGTAAKVILPYNWLADPYEDTIPYEAEIMHSGG